MTPYLFILIIIMLWIYLEQKTLKRKSFWFPLLMFSLFAGIRSYHVGTDSEGYVRSFISPIDIESFEFNENLEIGYQLLSYNLLKITNKYFWLFFITALIVVYCYLRIIKKYSVSYGFSIFLFFTLGTYTFFFNGLRQGLAMAIFTLAVPYILDRRFILYLLICCFAALFHTSALIMIPFYFIVNLNIKLIYKVLISFGISLFATNILLHYIVSNNPRYRTYTEDYEAGSGLLTLSFYLTVFFILYIFDYIYKIKNDVFDKLFAFYSTGIVFIIPIAMLGTNPSGPQRLIYYFTWALILLIPMALKRLNNRFFYCCVSVFALVFFIITTSKFGSLAPYLINPIFEIF